MLNNSISSFFILLGVVEYLSNGGVADNHKDFKELRYNECLMNFSCNGKNGSSEGRITHGFQLKSAYENNLMPYTNYTFDFKVSDSLWAGVEIISHKQGISYLCLNVYSSGIFRFAKCLGYVYT